MKVFHDQYVLGDGQFYPSATVVELTIQQNALTYIHLRQVLDYKMTSIHNQLLGL
jgi:hypothetical protein